MGLRVYVRHSEVDRMHLDATPADVDAHRRPTEQAEAHRRSSFAMPSQPHRRRRRRWGAVRRRANAGGHRWGLDPWVCPERSTPGGPVARRGRRGLRRGPVAPRAPGAWRSRRSGVRCRAVGTRTSCGRLRWSARGAPVRGCAAEKDLACTAAGAHPADGRRRGGEDGRHRAAAAREAVEERGGRARDRSCGEILEARVVVAAGCRAARGSEHLGRDGGVASRCARGGGRLR